MDNWRVKQALRLALSAPDALAEERSNERGGTFACSIDRQAAERHFAKTLPILKRYLAAQRDTFPYARIEALLEPASYAECREDPDEDEGDDLFTVILDGVQEALTEWAEQEHPVLEDLLAASLAVVLIEGFSAALTSWIEQFGLDPSTMTGLEGKIAEWSATHAGRLLERIGTRLAERISMIINQGYAEAVSVEEILRRIRALLEGGTEDEEELDRALWSDFKDVLYRAILETAEALGATEKEWVTMRRYNPKDRAVCLGCLNNEAMGFIPIGQLFSTGHRSPLAHPNCRCHLGFRGLSRDSILATLGRP